eukprot:TRINITY_DN21650_c0_g1_i1.p1 TRINITY_DN21650_c0_g1~~TRINITY_DN21650_c0_g1_i1.p1  ORF type:complete len:371 (+),score=42.92 TRINITY_DN21650_c0_g1_i1:107-1219(+)
MAWLSALQLVLLFGSTRWPCMQSTGNICEAYPAYRDASLSVKLDCSPQPSELASLAQLRRFHGSVLELSESHDVSSKPAVELDLIPCPYVASLVKSGGIVPNVSGVWNANQAEIALYSFSAKYLQHDLLASTMTTLAWNSGLIASYFGFAAASGANPTQESSLVEFPRELLLKSHTGIRLARVKFEIEATAWQEPCRVGGPLAGTSRCGQPGVHPEVFDKLASLIGKSDPEALWLNGTFWTQKGIEWSGFTTVNVGQAITENEVTSLAAFKRFWVARSGRNQIIKSMLSWGYFEDKADAALLCSASKTLFYATNYDGELIQDDSHYKLGSMLYANCEGMYRKISKTFGTLTTRELRDFVVHATFPENFNL